MTSWTCCRCFLRPLFERQVNSQFPHLRRTFTQCFKVMCFLRWLWLDDLKLHWSQTKSPSFSSLCFLYICVLRDALFLKTFLQVSHVSSASLVSSWLSSTRLSLLNFLSHLSLCLLTLFFWLIFVPQFTQSQINLVLQWFFAYLFRENFFPHLSHLYIFGCSSVLFISSGSWSPFSPLSGVSAVEGVAGSFD